MSRPARRIIYLNGEDTGLQAWSANEAIRKTLVVLRLRGRTSITAEALKAAHKTAPGRVDFTLPEIPQ